MIGYLFCPGDFMRDTSHLSELEELFYRRLIDHYMMTEKPIPNDLVRIKRIVRCPKRGQKWLQNVLQNFFFLEPDGYHNKRCDLEIEKVYKVSSERRLAAKSRWNKRNAIAYPNADANAMQLVCNPDPDPKKEKVKKEKSDPKPKKLPDNAFIEALKGNPAYSSIDIDRELSKMDAWFLTPQGRNRQKTARFIINWLNKIDVPLTKKEPIHDPANGIFDPRVTDSWARQHPRSEWPSHRNQITGEKELVL